MHVKVCHIEAALHSGDEIMPEVINRLGWHHKIELEEGIEKMYEWYLEDQR